jgi:ELWxxDGT repeat protein
VLGYDGATDPSFPEHLTVFEGYLYFSATDDRIYQLWWMNGNEMSQVTDVNAEPFGPSFYPSHLKVASDSLYFTANDRVHGSEIWNTYTYETIQVADMYPGDRSSSPHFYHDWEWSCGEWMELRLLMWLT